jgi:hypothetical protein
MNLRGGGGPDGTQGGGYPAACNEVRVVNAAGGILECLTVQEACARGVVSGSLCTTGSSASVSSVESAQAATTLAVPGSPVPLDAGCFFCGGLLVLLVIADAVFGTNLIIRRGKG